MTKGLSGLRAFTDRFFPERQFYHRSHGEVHFVSLSGRVQLAYITLTLAFLTWVGYASVNVVFKEQIITEQQRNFVEKEKDLQQQIFDLQAAFDEANATLAYAEEQFQNATEELEVRHKKLRSLVEHKQALNNANDDHRQIHLAQRHQDSSTGQGNVVLMTLTEREPTQRMSRRIESERSNTVQSVTTAFANMFKRQVSGIDRKVDLAERVASAENRVEDLRDHQRSMITELEESAQIRSDRARAIIAVTGLEVSDITRRFERAATAQGGPLIELGDLDKISSTLNGDNEDPAFNRQIFRLANRLQELSVLESAVRHLPTIKPVRYGIRYTSSFGQRRDPKTGRLAFHSGIDIAQKDRGRGAPIVSAAPGVVTYAGPKGPYGNLIEIDHGYGFKTRYAHLHKILVKRGEKVDFYQKIATLGNTGRSTGPHLHYEIWFNNKLKNPAKFFEAGNYVFKE